MAKKIRFICTAFRDGLQSVYGARAYTEDFMPAVEAAREAGITYLEAGGGARFKSLYFYCNEDAFDMMDRFREVAGPNADLQTLARGVNVVGLESQSSDIDYAMELGTSRCRFSALSPGPDATEHEKVLLPLAKAGSNATFSAS